LYDERKNGLSVQHSLMDEPDDWETRVAAFWDNADTLSYEELVRNADLLASERPDDPAALFERASARDRAGIEAEAETFYRAALASERLDPYRRARATIQLASTLRILGQLDESERLLVAEIERRSQVGGEHVLHDELRAFLALTYVAQGRASEAAGVALLALAPHLTRYHRSVRGNAEELVEHIGLDLG
jgi:tetratricopeptide (TPR) repeat protein